MRAYHEQLHNIKMKSGDDSDNFLHTINGYRKRLQNMGQPMHNEGLMALSCRPFLPSTRVSALSAMRVRSFTWKTFGA